jgi:hypothetical protein
VKSVLNMHDEDDEDEKEEELEDHRKIVKN